MTTVTAPPSWIGEHIRLDVPIGPVAPTRPAAWRAPGAPESDSTMWSATFGLAGGKCRPRPQRTWHHQPQPTPVPAATVPLPAWLSNDYSAWASSVVADRQSNSSPVVTASARRRGPSATRARAADALQTGSSLLLTGAFLSALASVGERVGLWHAVNDTGRLSISTPQVAGAVGPGDRIVTDVATWQIAAVDFTGTAFEYVDTFGRVRHAAPGTELLVEAQSIPGIGMLADVASPAGAVVMAAVAGVAWWAAARTR